MRFWMLKQNKVQNKNSSKFIQFNRENIKLMSRPMTITEKIFAAHAGKDEVKAGESIIAKFND